MSTCGICSEVKPDEEFFIDPRRRAPSSRCLDCHRAKCREYGRRYRSVNRERERARWREVAKARTGRRVPEHDAARRALRTALASGRVTRPDSCAVCGVRCIPHGHHEDYAMPLSVEWLCSLCHGLRHRKLDAMKKPT